MIKLSPRLQLVFDLIPKCGVFADIGCDHGYLSIAVAQAQKADKIIAMDINKGPLMSAQENVEAEGLSEIIELRLSDGIRKLAENEANVICICGMGGVLMKRIIETDLVKAKNADCLILEPQSEYMEFRRFLVENGFLIEDEAITSEENKYYPIIKATYDPDNVKFLSDVELKYGPCLLEKKPDLLFAQLEKSKKEFSEIRDSLKGKISDTNKAIPMQKRIDELEYEISLIDQAYHLLGGR